MKKFWKKLFGWLIDTAEPVAKQHAREKLKEVSDKNLDKPREKTTAQRFREAQQEGDGE